MNQFRGDQFYSKQIIFLAVFGGFDAQKMCISRHKEWRSDPSQGSPRVCKMATSYFVDDFLLFTGQETDTLRCIGLQHFITAQYFPEGFSSLADQNHLKMGLCLSHFLMLSR